MVFSLPDSWLNWNLVLQVLVFGERGKPEYPEKNLSEQRIEPATNSTHIWQQRQDLNLGHIGGRRVLSPLHHPFLHSFKEQVAQDALQVTLFFESLAGVIVLKKLS